MKVFGFLFAIFVGSAVQASTPLSTTYEAGVVEFGYESDPSLNAAQRLASNLAKYLEIMESAPADLDIIVFPEMTLNGMESAVETPEPDQKISPCDSSDFAADNLLKNLSCSAKTYERYLVVNIVTKVQCPDADMSEHGDTRNCTDRPDGLSYYNTNLVFDREGSVISRYRKFNLFGETVDKPLKPAMVTFETDFGVKFGHFVCFDLMFREPALELVRNDKVTDIVFTSMWFSEMPFLTAAQVQQNWAYSNNVNLLAAGANNPSVGSTGTGIYAARKGSLISVMEGSFTTKLHTATVPKKGLGDEVPIVENVNRHSKETMAPLKLKRDQLDKYNIKFIDSSPGTITVTEQCFDELCCTFKYNFILNPNAKGPSYSYALAVYHGNRTFDGFYDGGVLACAVLACKTKDIASCGLRDESIAFAHQFQTLEVSGNFPYGDQFFYLPNSLDESIMSFGVREFEYRQAAVLDENQTPKHNLITMKSLGTIRSFYAFGIYGRDFNLDGPPAASEPDTAGSVQAFAILVATLSVIATLRNFL